MGYKLVKGATIGAVSALGLAAAMNVNAVEFEAGDTSVDLYGFARFAAAYDIDENIDRNSGAGSLAAVNTSDEDVAEGHFTADAVSSRLGVMVNTANDVTINLEGDWRGSGSSNFRFRQGWGEWNNILAGQTWSNYNSFVGNTPTIDFDSTVGKAGLQGRVAQMRYTMGDFSVSAEDPNSLIKGGFEETIGEGTVDSFGTDGAAATDPLPAFTARYESSAGPVGYSVGGIVRQLKVDDGTDDDTATGWGAFIAGSFELTNAVSLQGNFQLSDGANSYVYRSGDEFAGTDAYVDPNGDLETITGMGGSVGVSVAAGPGTFNVAYGRTELDWDDAEDDDLAVGGERETNQTIHVNYLWNPTDSITYGVEFQNYDVEQVNGDDGDANRIALLAQYNF